MKKALPVALSISALLITVTTCALPVRAQPQAREGVIGDLGRCGFRPLRTCTSISGS
jgi:hypothetical protein